MKKILMALIVPALLAVHVQAEWYFESTTTATGGQPGQSAMMNNKLKSRISGNSIRTDMVESQNPMMPAGSYMISTDGGKTMKLVNPANKSYAVMDLQSMAGMFSGGMFKIVNPRFEKIVDEDGGELLGRDVRHVKFKTSYSMEMNIMGMKNTTVSESTQEMWVAPGILREGQNFWAGQKGFATGDKEFDRKIVDEMAKINGLPLKQVITSKNTAGSQVTESVMTTLVTTLRKENVPESAFVIPAGYTEQSMMASAMGGAEGESGSGSEPAFDPAALSEMMKKMKLPQR